MSFDHVTNVGANAFRRCQMLGDGGGAENLLSTWTSVESLGVDFMSECSQLKHLDCSPLRKLTQIHDRFLAECTNLETVDFSCLERVSGIHNYFLYRCSSIVEIDFSSLVGIESIADSFLAVCTALRPPRRFVQYGEFATAGCPLFGRLPCARIGLVTSYLQHQPCWITFPCRVFPNEET